MKLKDFLSEGNAASSKRLICFALAVCYVVQHFLLMYVKIEIPNKDLVASSQSGLMWLTLAFGGFIALPEVMSKMNLGQPKNVITQDVEKQTVIASDKTEVKSE